MKKMLPIVSCILVLLLLQSCSKSVIQPYQTNITGNWVLAESSENYGNGWRYFNTGLEGGNFTFYANGNASYSDGYNRMEGYWNIRTISGGYYDQYGNYYNNIHEMFEVHLNDRFTYNTIDLNFDDVMVTGNRIIATSYSGGVISRYIFVRY